MMLIESHVTDINIVLFNLGQREISIMVRASTNQLQFHRGRTRYCFLFHLWDTDSTLCIILSYPLKFDLSSVQTNWNLMKSHNFHFLLATPILYVYTYTLHFWSRKKVKEQILQERDWYLHPGKHVMSIWLCF